MPEPNTVDSSTQRPWGVPKRTCSDVLGCAMSGTQPYWSPRHSALGVNVGLSVPGVHGDAVAVAITRYAHPVSNPTIRVVGLGGSLSARSTSLAALTVALEGAAQAGAETELLDVRVLDLPSYSPDVTAPTAAMHLGEVVAAAHGMVWSSPLYHGSVSGSFKNALDWLQVLAERDPPYLTDKVIGLIATAGGTQGLQAINTMEFVVRALRGWAVPMVLPITRAWQAFDRDGVLTDEPLRKQLLTLGGEVVRAARQMQATGTCDYAHR
jgi:FMN reductase